MDFHEQRKLLMLSEDPNTPPAVLIKLADNNYHFVRYNLSLNPNTPAEALVKVADIDINENRPFLKRFILEHPNTPTYLKHYIQTRIYLNQYGLS